MATEREKTWEGRIWTGAQLFMSAAVLWGASTLWDLSKTVARIDERLSYALTTQASMASSQAMRDGAQDLNIEELRKSVNLLREQGRK